MAWQVLQEPWADCESFYMPMTLNQYADGT
jgi:hypothetical protein